MQKNHPKVLRPVVTNPENDLDLMQMKKRPGPVDDSSFETSHPATCSPSPEVLLHTQDDCAQTDRNSPREQVAGRRNMNGQQTLNFFLFFCVFVSLFMRFISIGTTTLIPEEAYYWNYTNHLDFGYLDHPPMVAWLIKFFTFLFGINEFGVRIASILCWATCAFFSYRLTECFKAQSGKYALFLLSILPFFFIHSLIITPDLPLIACWSAALYYLYAALVLDDENAWIYLGVWIGLGMLSKYTISLLAPSTLLYLVMIRESRRWFLSWRPYVCLLIIIALFFPVLYWNATHHWVSFLFQTVRRLQDKPSFSLHELAGLLIVFLTPMGAVEFSRLVKKHPHPEAADRGEFEKRRFVQIFTLTPLLIFSIFSLTHQIKFNWIGPGLLAFIPWIGEQMSRRNQTLCIKKWLYTGFALLISYMVTLYCLNYGRPVTLYHALLNKYIDWHDFTQQVEVIAGQTEKEFKSPVILIPIDRYYIASEIGFYQKKSNANHPPYSIIGSDLFGYESLMYRYWSTGVDMSDHILILISLDANTFQMKNITDVANPISSTNIFWAHSPGMGANVIPYYYQLAKLKKT